LRPKIQQLKTHILKDIQCQKIFRKISIRKTSFARGDKDSGLYFGHKIDLCAPGKPFETLATHNHHFHITQLNKIYKEFLETYFLGSRYIKKY
jgi:hypothetical protein